MVWFHSFTLVLNSILFSGVFIVYSLFCWRISWLLPSSGKYEKKNLLNNCVHVLFQLLWISLKEHTTASYVVQLLSPVQLFVTPWTAAHQASLSFTIFLSLLKLMSTESLIPSNSLILCLPLLLLLSIFPSIRVFSNESVLHIRWPKIGVSASASIFPMYIQSWFPLELTALISCHPRNF